MHAAYKYSVAFIPDDCTSAYTVTLPLHRLLPFHGYASMHAGADVNARDHRKQTPLHVAAEGGVMKPAENQKSIINLLLEHRADVHAVAEDRKNVLHYAAQTGKAETIKQMIESGLCVNKDDKNGWTPLHVAVHHGCKVAAAVLIEKGQLWEQTVEFAFVRWPSKGILFIH